MLDNVWANFYERKRRLRCTVKETQRKRFANRLRIIGSRLTVVGNFPVIKGSPWLDSFSPWMTPLPIPKQKQLGKKRFRRGSKRGATSGVAREEVMREADARLAL
jgi:hypothetical protein